MVKIMLDAGHGGHDPGATYKGHEEEDIALQICKVTRDVLNDHYSASVRLTREGDKYLSLGQRCDLANDWGADLFVSMHLNAGKGNGYESYIYRSASQKSKEAQNALHKAAMEVCKAYGWPDRGKKTAGFYVLKHTKMPAVLCENGFIDNDSNLDELTRKEFINKLGTAYAHAIADVMNLPKKSGSSKPSPKKQPSYMYARYTRLLRLQRPLMQGDDVKKVQDRLNVKVDGIFGPITEGAVENWQRLHDENGKPCEPYKGLQVDGIVGPKTWNALF